jgi:hypothetical protein
MPGRRLDTAIIALPPLAARLGLPIVRVPAFSSWRIPIVTTMTMPSATPPAISATAMIAYIPIMTSSWP